MRIAVGFDGTIVENKYPQIGHPKPSAVRILKKLAAEGHQLILWTSRSGVYFEEAVEWCRSRGLKFYAYNSNHPDADDEESRAGKSPKISADVYIDGANLGGLPSWRKIYQMVSDPRKTFKIWRPRSEMRIRKLSDVIAVLRWEMAHPDRMYRVSSRKAKNHE